MIGGVLATSSRPNAYRKNGGIRVLKLAVLEAFLLVRKLKPDFAHNSHDSRFLPVPTINGTLRAGLPVRKGKKYSRNFELLQQMDDADG